MDQLPQFNPDDNSDSPRYERSIHLRKLSNLSECETTEVQQLVKCNRLHDQLSRARIASSVLGHSLNTTAVTSSLRALVPCQAANSCFIADVISSVLALQLALRISSKRR